MSHTVYLALGSNLGDRLSNLEAALAALPPAVRLMVASSVYETPPWGYLDQPAFLNQVVKVKTDLPPGELLTCLKALEVELGRVDSVRYGPRVIDLDILFYDDLVLEIPGLTIPHPRLHERAFVLLPLADMAPELRHPVEGATVVELLQRIDGTGIVPYR